MNETTSKQNMLVKCETGVYLITDTCTTIFRKVAEFKEPVVVSELSNLNNFAFGLHQLHAYGILSRSGTKYRYRYFKPPQTFVIANQIKLPVSKKGYGDICHCFFHNKELFLISGTKAAILAYLILHPGNYSYSQLERHVRVELAGKFDSLDWHTLIMNATQALKRLGCVKITRRTRPLEAMISLTPDPPKVVFQYVKTLTSREERTKRVSKSKVRTAREKTVVKT